MIASTRSLSCARAPSSAMRAPVPSSRGSVSRTLVRYKDDGEKADMAKDQKEYKKNREERYGGADHGTASKNDSSHGAHAKPNSNLSTSAATKQVEKGAKDQEGAENILEKLAGGVKSAIEGSDKE